MQKLSKMTCIYQLRMSRPISLSLDKSLLPSSRQIVSPARDGISDDAAYTDPPPAADLVSADLESSLSGIVSAHIPPARLLKTGTPESVGPPLKPGGDSETRLSAASTINNGAQSSPESLLPTAKHLAFNTPLPEDLQNDLDVRARQILGRCGLLTRFHARFRNYV